MDGENNGKPYEMDDFGIPSFLETPIFVILQKWKNIRSRTQKLRFNIYFLRDTYQTWKYIESIVPTLYLLILGKHLVALQPLRWALINVSSLDYNPWSGSLVLNQLGFVSFLPWSTPFQNTIDNHSEPASPVLTNNHPMENLQTISMVFANKQLDFPSI